MNSSFRQAPTQDLPAKPSLQKYQRLRLETPCSGDRHSAVEMLCSYQNRTPNIQIIRSAIHHEGTDWQLERVVFPSQRLLFHAPQGTCLRIFTNNSEGSLITDIVACDRLQVRKP